MLVSPLWVDLNDLLKDYLKFMDDHFKESADLTFLACRHRNYSKVIEFVQFKERLQHSHQYLMARLEASILQLKQKAESIEEEECILESLNFGIQVLEFSSEQRCKLLTFNEDVLSRPWWTPTPDKNYLLGPFEEGAFFQRDNMWQQRLVKEREENVQRFIERRSLLPRLIYLSIQSASSTLKENVEANGAISYGKNSLELKSLLERYSRSLGLSFNDAVEEIVGISNGEKNCKVSCMDIIDWMNFAVFFNAWKLGSHELGSPDGDGPMTSSWCMVDNLIEKYILEKLRSMKPLITSFGADLPVLVQMVTEPLAWHSLIIQSCIRSSHPSGKKKKKSGPADHFTFPLSRVIQVSIQSLCGVMEDITKWLREQINNSEDESLDALLIHFKSKGSNEVPGQVIQILETLASSPKELELGDHISQALHSCSSDNFLRKIVTGQRKTISEFLLICESKLNSLQTLKQQVRSTHGRKIVEVQAFNIV